jgi:DNA mismatch repair ATPase MutS
MTFTTDKQTLTDLGIFPSNKYKKSILDCYNHTKTKGGEKVLYDTMQAPLNSRKEIEERIANIRFCEGITDEINHILDPLEFDLIEHYFNQKSKVLKDNIIDATFDYLSYKFKPNNNYYLISKAVEYISEILAKLFLLKEKIIVQKLPDFFLMIAGDIEYFQDDSKLHKLIYSKDKFPQYTKISKFDNVLRGEDLYRFKELLQKLYMLDMYNSVGCVSKQESYNFPKFSTSNEARFSLQQVFHPLISDPVPTDFDINEKENFCFLSGPNMAGKSTILTAISVSMYLAHLGFPLPAKSCELTVFNGMYTTINLSDNIELGYSHYYSEVKRVKDVAINVREKKKVFVVFDELFRGTNVKDAYDASLMICKAFRKINSSFFIVSSHITEVGEELQKCGVNNFMYFDSYLDGDLPVNTYQLKDGISHERHGLTIVKREGIVELLEEESVN